MQDINSEIYFTKGIYLYLNQRNEWAINSKNDNVYLELFETKNEAVNYALDLGAEFLDREELTCQKIDLLKGFFSHAWNAYHNGGKLDSDFWADQLDGLHIPYFVQNAVSCLADNRESAFKYLEPQFRKIWSEWLDIYAISKEVHSHE